MSGSALAESVTYGCNAVGKVTCHFLVFPSDDATPIPLDLATAQQTTLDLEIGTATYCVSQAAALTLPSPRPSLSVPGQSANSVLAVPPAQDPAGQSAKRPPKNQFSRSGSGCARRVVTRSENN